jgi:hypothetical protein
MKKRIFVTFNTNWTRIGQKENVGVGEIKGKIMVIFQG